MFLSSTLQDHEKLNNKTFIKLLNTKSHIPLVKNNVFLSMHYLILATLFDHFVPVYTFEMFGFHRYNPRVSQICVKLTRETFLVWQEKKEWRNLHIFLKSEGMNARYFEWTWWYASVSLLILCFFNSCLCQGDFR